jgi:outer membrane protein assembly factor BamB
MTRRVAFSVAGPAQFRHHAGRSILSSDGDGSVVADWGAEPVVVGHRHLLHRRANGEEIPVPICATPAIIGKAGIVLAAYDGMVRFLDPTLTKEYWSISLPAAVYAPVVVDAVGPAVLVGCIDGTVFRLGLRGAIEWSVSLRELPIYPAPLVLPEARLLVIATYHGRCFGLDLDDGSIRFELWLPRPWHLAKGGLAAWRDPYASPVAVTETTFVQCCAENAMLIDECGEVLWEHTVGTPVRASPAFIAATGEVLVVSTSGHCWFIAAETGNARVGHVIDGRVVASPAVSGDIAAIGTTAGELVGVDVSSRSVAWRKAGFAPRDHSSIAVLPSGAFVLTTERGTAVALRNHDGHFLWESDQRLGAGNQDPRMDLTPLAAPDGRLYCASYSGNIYSFAFPARAPQYPTIIGTGGDNAAS